MVKLTKSELPEGLVINKDRDYREGEIFQILLKDCLRKCYICEIKPIPPEVEHRLTHKHDKALKHDWNNIFYSCRYCNKVKNDRKYYSGILDPTKLDPEEYIDLHMDYTELSERVVIVNKIKDDGLVDITMDLLDTIFNNESTDINLSFALISTINSTMP